MNEEDTMTATFEPTLDVWKLIEGEPTEYIVVNPTVIEARFKSGEVRRFQQEIRERVVRCRDCRYALEGGRSCVMFAFPLGTGDVIASDVRPDGFCAWGEPRKEKP